MLDTTYVTREARMTTKNKNREYNCAIARQNPFPPFSPIGHLPNLYGKEKWWNKNSQIIWLFIFKSKMKTSRKDLFWYVTIIEIKSTNKGKQAQYIENKRGTSGYIQKELAPQIQK